MAKKTRERPVVEFLKNLLPGSDVPPMQAGLRRLNSRLGFRADSDEAREREHSPIAIHSTLDTQRSIYYAPDMDGQPEPGEVVWIWAPCDGPDAPLRDRAILVIGHNRTTVLGLLISPNPTHAEEPHWLDIGAGEWDESGRPCWLRLDRVLEVSQLGIRRQGVTFPRPRFERVATKLRSSYGWS